MFEKLKNLFVVDDGSTPQKVESKKDSVSDKQSSKSTNKIEKTFESDPIIGKAIEGKINPKFIDKLLKSIERNNMEGFDYLEYKQTLQNLDKSMLEETRYESAFAMAKTMGVTAQQLKDSAQFYIDILKREEKKFDDALKNQVSKQITQRKQDFKGLENAIIEKEKQIELIKKEIEAHKAKLKASNSELNAAKLKINRTKAEFDLSYQSVYNQIKDDLAKITKYVK